VNQILAASIANQRRAQLIDDAQEYRRAHAARLSRPARSRTGTIPNVGRRLVFAPVDAFRSWLAAGML
jgi:hypothetical protein